MSDSRKRGKRTKPRKIYEGIIIMACSLLVYWEGQNNPNWSQVLRNVIDKKKNLMVGWHHQLNEHEFEQGLGDGEGQGCLVCCSPWGCKDWDMTEWLNHNKLTKKKSSSFRRPLSFCFGEKYQKKRDGNNARNLVEIKELASHTNG